MPRCTPRPTSSFRFAEIQRLMGKAKEPKRLWVIKASNHRFSGNEKEFDARLIAAMAWVKAQK